MNQKNILGHIDDELPSKNHIIAFSGAHGTGKTTAVFDWAAKTKKTTNGSVGVLQETARECPYPILSAQNNRTSEEGQLWIFTTQIQRELSYCRQYDYLITDRTCVDSIAYTIFGGHLSLAEAMVSIARRHVHRYRMIFFKSIEQNAYCKEDGVRSTDIHYRKEIEEILLDLYEDLQVDIII